MVPLVQWIKGGREIEKQERNFREEKKVEREREREERKGRGEREREKEEKE